MIVSWRHGVLSHLFLNFSCGGSCFFGVSRRAKLQSVRESEVLHSKPQRGSSAALPRQGTNSEYGLDMTWTSWNKMSKLVRRVGVAKEWEKCFALKSAKFLKHWAVPFAGHVHSWKDTTWIWVRNLFLDSTRWQGIRRALALCLPSRIWVGFHSTSSIYRVIVIVIQSSAEI